MNRITSLMIGLAFCSAAMAQFGLRGVGVGFAASGGGGMRSDGLGTLMAGQEGFEDELGTGIVMSRTNTSYTFSFDGEQTPYFALDLSVMQGATNMYNNAYEWRQNQDSFFSRSVNFDSYGATLGLRAMAKFRTDPDRRFHYHFGLGAEGLYTYGVSTYGSRFEEASHWPSQYFESESTTLDLDVLRNFQSHQIIQQVGAAFRLGKDEEVYPLNRTYVELNFNILSNFTLINEDWSSYRTYGGSLRLVYELN